MLTICVHHSEPTDYTKLWTEMRERISLVKSGEPKPGQGSFGHIVGGYDAGALAYCSARVGRQEPCIMHNE
ncbi:hypothetical protein EDD17DRAFT_889802 [Pisolithus thermaeus]|nr:hypothetical protein EDD17DRAFT_889802 [Pisolithus thermaeus]